MSIKYNGWNICKGFYGNYSIVKEIKTIEYHIIFQIDLLK